MTEDEKTEIERLQDALYTTHEMLDAAHSKIDDLIIEVASLTKVIRENFEEDDEKARLYIVQMKDEPHEPVGVFWASSLYELSMKVDTCGDPNYCEFAELPRGEGISLEGENGGKDPWMQPIAT